MIFIGILIGTVLGIFFMDLMTASSRRNICEECHIQRAIAAMNYVARNPRGKVLSKWTLMEDKLPEKDGDYLVTITMDHRPFIFILGFHNGKFFGDKGEEPNNKRILAWMELPEPYRRGADNNV